MLTRAELRTVLRARGLRLTKRFGQNILVNRGIRDRLVEAMALQPDDLVVEIGAGTGALTEALAARAAHVVAFEIDRGLEALLHEQLAETSNVEVRDEDFLDADLHELAGRAGGTRLVIAGNLPYSITTPAITRVLESGVAFRAAYFTIQREVAHRLLAGPGTRECGAISCLIEYHTEARRLVKVPPSAFEPVPKVESALLGLVRRERAPVAPRDPALMFAVIRAAFGARRKALKNALRRLEWGLLSDDDVSTAMRACGLAPGARAEQLALQQFADLSDALLCQAAGRGSP
ncbi:MAG: ribosomal RNA small subunit methyltransferase A [Verrucomicrobia bacterium]|nr:ribosomal RNA small subunit methyltransferase A [Verrucomicrobiota bacterium]